ncbi:MAG: DNA polymerase I [Bacteroidales bacterium]|nr:DNA polymerase I [Bacteroidales bacterium]
MDKLFLIDGHALIFRMYYAFMRRPMINSKGVDTSILYGFTKYLLEIISKQNPTHLAVAFDPHAATFRHEAYPAYKANRSEAPELVHAALEPLCELLKAMDIPVLMRPGFEADDVICSAAKHFAGDTMQVYMVTPDKDFGQAVHGNIFQFKPGKAGEDDLVLDEPAICANYGIASARQVIDILTIWGDASDNVPGVAGVGEVGAKKLIGKYGSVENIYAHLDELTPKLRESFEAARDHIEMSKFLVTIKDDIDVGVTLNDLRFTTTCTAAVRELFDKYEFRSLLKMLPEGDGSAAAAPGTKHLNCSESSPVELFAAARAAGSVALSVSDKIILASGDKWAEFEYNDRAALSLLSDPFVAKCGHGLKEGMHRLGNAASAIQGPLKDIEIMHYLLNPEVNHKIDYLLRSYLEMELEPDAESGQDEQPVQLDLFSMPAPGASDKEAETARRSCVAAGMLAPVIEKELRDKNLWHLYEKIEMPLIGVLFDMECEGVRIDVEQLHSFGASLEGDIARLEAQIREIAGDPALNVQSPKQIGVLLFEKLKLDPKVKKSRTGAYPTDEETLQALNDRHPVIGMILEYRGLKKLMTTYIAPFPGYINPADGRVHTTFTQALTATGRLSSVKPNLQNIPVRTSLGQEIRRAFVPGADWIVAADYSQIELRIMAHLSGDPSLVADFQTGDDIHAATAAKIFNVPVSEVTKDQRRQAKTANFGIMYGISSFGLAQRLGIPRGEAKALIDDYYRSFPGIRTYVDKVIAQAREKGYVETIFGRRRYLPDINSKNFTVRSLAERNAVNAPIQGSSADIIKLAMIAIHRKLKSDGYRSRMVLQIHDELLFDVYEDEREKLMQMVVEQMQNVCKLAVPVIVDCNAGKNWLEAH